MPLHLDGWGGPVWDMPWSPDGRFLAFRAKRVTDGQKVGYSPSDQSGLAILDVNTGQTSVLSTSSGSFVWRSDGNAIRTLKRVRVPEWSPSYRSRLSIVEIPLNGPERLLRDISTEFPNANEVVFTSDREVVVSVATGQGPERFLVPLDGGAARRLPNPGTEPGSRVGETVVAGTQLLLPQLDANGEVRVVKILSTVGDATRTLRLPASSSYAVALPDAQQIISLGRATGDSLYKLFLVPLDGSAPRLIGEIPLGTDVPVPSGGLAPSPDGKLLAYTVDGRYTSKIFEIDLGPVLQAIMTP